MHWMYRPLRSTISQDYGLAHAGKSVPSLTAVHLSGGCSASTAWAGADRIKWGFEIAGPLRALSQLLAAPTGNRRLLAEETAQQRLQSTTAARPISTHFMVMMAPH